MASGSGPQQPRRQERRRISALRERRRACQRMPNRVVPRSSRFVPVTGTGRFFLQSSEPSARSEEGVWGLSPQAGGLGDEIPQRSLSRSAQKARIAAEPKATIAIPNRLLQGTAKPDGALLRSPALSGNGEDVVGRIGPVSIVDRVAVCSETTFSCYSWGCHPGNGIVAQALLSVSRRSARLHPPQAAAGFSPPNPAWGSTPDPARDFSPGNSHSRTAGGAPCDFRRSACLFRPLGAAGSGPLDPIIASRLF